MTLAQALKHIVTLHMADDGDMEAHIRDFTAGKRRVEEHGVALTDIVYLLPHLFPHLHANDISNDGYGDRISV